MFAKKVYIFVAVLAVLSLYWSLFTGKTTPPKSPAALKTLKKILEQEWEPNKQTTHQELAAFVRDLYPDAKAGSKKDFFGVRNGHFKRMELAPLDSTHYIFADKNTPMEEELNLSGGTYQLIPEQSNKYVRRYRLSSDNRFANAPEIPFYRVQYHPTQPELLWIYRTILPRNSAYDTLQTVWLFRKCSDSDYWDFVFKNQQTFSPLTALPALCPNLFVPNIYPPRDANVDYLYRVAPDTVVTRVFSLHSEEKVWRIHPQDEAKSPISFFYYRGTRELLSTNQDSLWVRHTYTGAMLFKLDTLRMNSPIPYREFVLNTPETQPILDTEAAFLSEFFPLPLKFGLFYQPLYGDTLLSVWAWDKRQSKYKFCSLQSDKNASVCPALYEYIRKKPTVEAFGWFDICQNLPEFKKDILAKANPIQKAGLEDWESLFYMLFNQPKDWQNDKEESRKPFIIKGL